MMSAPTLLFAAHDIGGGRVLVPVVEACRAARYRVAVMAQGPARQVLAGDLSMPDSLGDVVRAMSDLGPVVAVTGTSAKAMLEHGVWAAARRLRIPSVALVDASINLLERFLRPADGGAQPDVIGVIDTQSRRALLALKQVSARIEVVGQPHLERVGEIVGAKRRLSRSRHRFVYFSEPIVDAPGGRHRVGFDQFSVLERALPGFADAGKTSLIVKPHPNENPDPWRHWLARVARPAGVSLSLGNGDALRLMADAQGVLGMASMALIEASLAGIPTLALQPGRSYCPNPRIDASPAIRLLTDPSTLGESTGRFVREAMADAGDHVLASHPFAGSTERVMQVIAEAIAAGDGERAKANAATIHP